MFHLGPPYPAPIIPALFPLKYCPLRMLPSSRDFLDSLLPKFQSTSCLSSTPSSLRIDQKPLFLTLHCLFPNELLPALDVLDRKLVTRFLVKDSPPAKALLEASIHKAEGVGDVKSAADVPIAASPPTATEQKGGSVYYVRSSHQSRSRFGPKRNESTSAEGINYEVRLQAWNCSCAAFTFAAFGGEREGFDENLSEESAEFNSGGSIEQGGWKVGGMTLGEVVPMCKHLLACVLAERIEGLEECIDERFVSKEEMAGWAAGWGG